MSRVDNQGGNHVLSIYIGERTNKELYDHISHLKENNLNVSDFIKSAAEFYLKNKDTVDKTLDDRIRHIIETEYAGKVSATNENVKSYQDVIIHANNAYDD